MVNPFQLHILFIQGQGFADKKKHAVVREYQKMLQKEKNKANRAQLLSDSEGRPQHSNADQK